MSLPHVGWGTKFFDYDNDGWVDLFVANGHVYPQLPNYRQPRLLHRNNRDGTFTEVSAQFGAVLTEQRASRGVAFGDIDNDGDVDLVDLRSRWTTAGVAQRRWQCEQLDSRKDRSE